VDFFTVFVGDGGIVCGAGVGAEDDAVFVDEAYDCGSGFGGEGGDIVFGGAAGGGGFLDLCFDEGVTVDVFEIEASLGSGV